MEEAEEAEQPDGENETDPVNESGGASDDEQAGDDDGN